MFSRRSANTAAADMIQRDFIQRASLLEEVAESSNKWSDMQQHAD